MCRYRGLSQNSHFTKAVEQLQSHVHMSVLTSQLYELQLYRLLDTTKVPANTSSPSRMML